MKIKSVNAIFIASQNPKRLIEFYQKLGIDLKVADHGGGVHAEIDFGPVHFAIWGGGNPPHKSNTSFSFHVPELEEFCEELEKKGITLEEKPHSLPFGGVVATLRDPDGNKIVFMRWNSEK